MSSLDQPRRPRLKTLGQRISGQGSTRMDDLTRAMSLSSYEDGGLEKVFRAILHGPGLE